MDRNKFTIGTSEGIEELLGHQKPKQTFSGESTRMDQDEGESAEAVVRYDDEEEAELKELEDVDVQHVTDVDGIQGDKELGSDDPPAKTTNQSSSATSLTDENVLPPPSLLTTNSHSSSSDSSVSSNTTTESSSKSSSPAPSSGRVYHSNQSATAAAPLSTRASTRNILKATDREDDDPKYWSFDAGNYLKKALAGFEIDKAIYWMKELDRTLGFPKGNVSISFTPCSNASSFCPG